MSDRSKLFIIAHIPAALEHELLQYVRNFDSTHADCHFEIGIEGPDHTMPEMVEMLRVDPALTFTKIFERKQRADCCRRYATGQTFCDDCPATVDFQLRQMSAPTLPEGSLED